MPIDAHLREAIGAQPERAWTPAVDPDGQPRADAEVVELTGWVDLHTWPPGTRAICRREDAHPGAQLRFSDHDGHRFQVFLTDQPDPDLAGLELRHRQRARVEDRIRAAKATGLPNLPFDRWRRNQVWLELVLAAQDLTVWTQALLLDGALAARRAQDPALPAAPCRRPGGPPRPPHDPSPATLLALGHQARQGVHPAACPAAALLSRPPSADDPLTPPRVMPPCPPSRPPPPTAGTATPAPPRPATQPSRTPLTPPDSRPHDRHHALMKSRG